MFDVIIAAGGLSSRAGVDKLSAAISGQSVLTKTVNAFINIEGIQNIIVVSDTKYELPPQILTVRGGKTRSESVKNGLEKATAPFVLIHDGARPFVSYALIRRVMGCAEKFGSAVPMIKSADSLRAVKDGRIESLCDRETVLCAQTPQGYSTEKLKHAYLITPSLDNTDESELYLKFAEPPYVVEGEISNKKITYFEDLANLNSLIGSGFDVHRLVPGRKLILGGINIDYHMGLQAHSDGDVLIHAVMDALLTAAGLPDIGTVFPDTDPAFEDADSAVLLADVKKLLNGRNVRVINLTAVIMAQEPKLSKYLPLMAKRIAGILDISESAVNLSCTTTENLGVTAKNGGIACIAFTNVA